MPEFLADFRFNYPRAVGDQLQEAFENLIAGQLRPELVDLIPDGVGVYMLFHPDPQALVYIGKADGGLRNRLARHFRKLSGRRIDASAVYFKGALLEEDYLAVAPEDILIKRLTPYMVDRWNGKGFGPNDPGRERDTTRLRTDHFDVRFPARFDWPVNGLTVASTVGSAVLRLQEELPYTFRVDERLRPHGVMAGPLAQLPVGFPGDELPAREAFRHLTAALPPGWQITALPGYVIGYEEERQFPSAVRYWRGSSPGETFDGPMVSLDP